MLSEIQGAKCVVGVKQSKKAIKEGAALKAFIAENAETRVVKPIIEACAQYSIPIERTATMSELGKACSIDVGASVVVILK